MTAQSATIPTSRTPESILVAAEGAPAPCVLEASLVASALSSMKLDVEDDTGGAGPQKAPSTDVALCLEDIVIQCSPNEDLNTSKEDSNPFLALVMHGLLGDELQRFPMEAASKGQWKLSGFVQLPGKLGDLEIVAQSTAGPVGSVTLTAEELHEARQSSNNGIITKKLLKSGPGYTLTLAVRSLMTKDGQIDPDPNTLDHIDIRFGEGLSLLNQALDLFTQCQNSGNPAELVGVISRLRKAVTFLPPTSSELIDALAGLSVSSRAIFDTTGNRDDLDGAVAASEEEIALLSSRDNEGYEEILTTALKRHALDLYSRYERFGEHEDLDKAILSQRQCISSMKETTGTQWGNLGAFLLRRFERFGQLDDIDEAVKVQELAIGQTPDGTDDMSWSLASLGSALYVRFKRTGDTTDLEKGLSYLKNARSLTELGSSGLDFILNNLGGALMRRFECFGEATDINDAIAVYHQVLHTTPEDDSRRFTFLNNLSLALLGLYQHSRDMETIEEAVDTLQSAVQATPVNHHTLPLTLNNLASALMKLFEQTHDLNHLEESIEAQESAIEILPKGHPLLSTFLDNLGMKFQGLYMETEDPSSIDNAVNAHRRAVEYSSPGLSEYPLLLYNIGRDLRLRCRTRSGVRALEDMDEAISFTETALTMTPDGHSFRATLFHSLAQSYEVRFSLTKDTSDVKAAADYFSDAALCITSPPESRLTAARQWSEYALTQMDQEQSLAALSVGIELIALVVGMEQTVERRYEQIPNLSLFVLNAVAFSVMIRRLDKALEWLEQGRGLVWSQLSNLRTPLDTLNTIDPAITAGFRDVCERLEKAGRQEKLLARIQASMEQRMSLHEEAATHFRLAKDREDLLCRIRTTIPGFENFLRPLPSSALLENLPKTGVVIVLSIHLVQCSAIALRAGFAEPTLIPLPEFSYDQAKDLRQLLHHTANSRGLGSRGEGEEEQTESRGVKKMMTKNSGSAIEEILRQLWLGIAKPIIDALDIQTPTVEKPVRIWWCMTGLSTFLPIHAAGIYRGPEAVALDDYVVSSYIPTITSLTDRVKNAAERVTPETKSGLLLITQPEAPGLPRIPGTRAEVERIGKHADEHGIRSLRLDDNQATVEAGLKAMEDYSCVHLACHAKQDLGQPLRSGFYLKDGQLELSSILQMNLKSADFAFLSACQTSMGSDDLSEEAVHLAAGMLAAGYRGVVATMWSIQDGYAVGLADDFYADLLSRNNRNGRESVIEGSDAAYSLHYAVRALRRKYGNTQASFFAWVPYVHCGF